MEPNKSSCSPESQLRKRTNHTEIDNKIILEDYDSIHDQQQNIILTIYARVILLILIL